MTICPLNYMNDFAKDDENYTIKVDLIGQVCPSLLSVYWNNGPKNYMANVSYDIEAWTRQLKPFIDETFIYCDIRNENLDCYDLLSESFTAVGLCYTINGLASRDLYRENVYVWLNE